MTKPRSRSRKKTPPPRPARRWWPLLGKLALVALLLFTVALVWLDVLVRQRFDTHQLPLPALVYARPVGRAVGRVPALDHLPRPLRLLRLRVDPVTRTPGAYSVNGSSVLLHTRGFNDSDGGEKPRLLRLTIENNRVQRLVDGAGNKIPVARLEPVQIGSIHPGHQEDRVLVRS